MHLFTGNSRPSILRLLYFELSLHHHSTSYTESTSGTMTTNMRLQSFTEFLGQRSLMISPCLGTWISGNASCQHYISLVPFLRVGLPASYVYLSFETTNEESLRIGTWCWQFLPKTVDKLRFADGLDETRCITAIAICTQTFGHHDLRTRIPYFALLSVV